MNRRIAATVEREKHSTSADVTQLVTSSAALLVVGIVIDYRENVEAPGPHALRLFGGRSAAAGGQSTNRRTARARSTQTTAANFDFAR